MTDSRRQLCHHGVEIPFSQQPRCPECGGYMSLHRLATGGGPSFVPGVYTEDKVDWLWACLDDGCPGQISLSPAEIPPGVEDGYVVKAPGGRAYTKAGRA